MRGRTYPRSNPSGTRAWKTELERDSGVRSWADAATYFDRLCFHGRRPRRCRAGAGPPSRVRRARGEHRRFPGLLPVRNRLVHQVELFAPAAVRAVVLRPDVPALVQAPVVVGLHRPPRHVRRRAAAAQGDSRERRGRGRLHVPTVVTRPRQHAQEGLAEGPGGDVPHRLRRAPALGPPATSTRTSRPARSRPRPQSSGAARTRAHRARSSPSASSDATDSAREATRQVARASPRRTARCSSWRAPGVSATWSAPSKRSSTSASYHPVIICGNDTHLKATLEERGVGTVIGWTDEMPALMGACDAMVENAGGLTANEAFAVGLPGRHLQGDRRSRQGQRRGDGRDRRHPLRAERGRAARRARRGHGSRSRAGRGGGAGPRAVRRRREDRRPRARRVPRPRRRARADSGPEGATADHHGRGGARAPATAVSPWARRASRRSASESRVRRRARRTRSSSAFGSPATSCRAG